MAILVPFSSLVQMLPVSVNGHGVREGTFVAYLTRSRRASARARWRCP
jgi:hypothetical protein